MVPLGEDRFATNQDAMVKLVGWMGNMCHVQRFAPRRSDARGPAMKTQMLRYLLDRGGALWRMKSAALPVRKSKRRRSTPAGGLYGRHDDGIASPLTKPLTPRTKPAKTKKEK